ncbi:Neutral/alkaline nonlysosomal ceramidase [Hysterangium stoloniferum]|nr:Neutral/alkaline nonlysosomal ceramidase [Hysterangium stoloniferum]
MPVLVDTIDVVSFTADFCQLLSATGSYVLDRLLFCLTAFLVTVSSFQNAGLRTQSAATSGYMLGLGIGDITGPVVETNMMGYAALSQTATGLHMRQRARAFVVAEASNSSNRILFLNIDTAMGDSGIRRGILTGLDQQFPGVYSESNVAVVGTHQHSGAGGYLENILPQVTSMGFVNQSFQAIVTGSINAVRKAHSNLAPGNLSIGNTTVLDANINRSPSAYLNNPAEERARYQFDQDKDLTLMQFDDPSGKTRGFLSFFAVHGTSLYENNTLISGDNKGMAAFLAESTAEPSSLPGKTTFVAGFSQSNVGDTSPNTLGAFCESPGQPWNGLLCTFNTSTCGGAAQDCHGRGPGFRISDFESNFLIGKAQADGAQAVMNKKRVPVSGSVRSVHQYINMAEYTFTLANGTQVTTCPAAMGFAFAGGTTDGPGAFDFTQGQNSSQPQNPFWQIVKGAITPYPNSEQVACHFPKPILLNTGYANTPYPWQPSVVNIQILRVGQLVILVIPGEFTTMAGRRIREAMRAKLIAEGVLGQDAYVVIAGPANTYAHYITTREEYAIQRYEGGSTIYGQFTLEAYMDIYSKLTSFLADNTSGAPVSATAPPDLTKNAISMQTPVIFDAPPFGKSFGDVLTNVFSTSYAAGDTVSVEFVGANPRNNLRLEETYLSVEQIVNQQWEVVRSDSHPSTTFQWKRINSILATSTVTANWTIGEPGTPSGTYRIQYFGDSKSIFGSISSFTGTSATFTVS